MKAAKSISGLRRISPFQFAEVDTEYLQALSRLHDHDDSAVPFRTDDGYSCLCPSGNCRIGDLVVIVPGVGVPLIVRRDDAIGQQHYRLFDFAYVHGMMDGESFEASRELLDIMMV